MTVRLYILACALLGSATAAAADAPRTGAFVTSFTQTTPLAAPQEVAARLGIPDPGLAQGITPSAESWHVYVPEDYDGTQAYGVLVWVSPYDSGELPGGWQHALKDHKLIYVAADKSGNAEDVVSRRVPLALTGLAGIEAGYKVDASRLYVGGFSGGGATASHVAAAYADLFSGGLFVSGSHGIGTDQMAAPASDRLQLMQSRGRYVFTVGGEEIDNQIMISRAVDAFRALCVLRLDYIHIANGGHANLESRVLLRALKYLDEPPDPSTSDQSECERALEKRRAAAVGDAVQAGRARDLLEGLRRDSGPLAELDYSASRGR